MRKMYLLLAVVAVAVTSCQKEVVCNDKPQQNQSIELADSNTRSYDEALAIAEDALILLESDETRSTTKRVIKRNEGQTVMRPVTRGSETQEEPIMYVFNNEDNQGFTIVAADRSQQPLIAVTEYGNYTYGEPTGVEPFDLLMEDVATTLVILPEEPLAIKEEIKNEKHKRYYPIKNIQWGTGTIYGAMYPDGVAYDEAAAIAQALMCIDSDLQYTITNPNDPLYGQTVVLNKTNMVQHVRYDHPFQGLTSCNDIIHTHISRLYYEIGYRLSNGTAIGLSNKVSSFPMTRVKAVFDSFNTLSTPIYSFNGNPIIAEWDEDRKEYKECVFFFKGLASELLPDSSVAHVWLATGFDDYSYDKIEYTLNKFVNPSHPDPYGYTETNRVTIHDYMLYMNWGFDGISNGWFHSGCFDMSKRIENGPVLGGYTDEYDYNFMDIEVFMGLPFPLV